MDIWLQLLLSLTALIGVGLSIVGLPGSVLIFFVLLTVAFVSSFTVATGIHLLWFGVITIGLLFVDNILVVFGAKRHGASKHGMLGAFLGGLFGVLIFGPIGIIIGPFIGAVILEFLFNPNFKKAINAGVGTFIGFFFSVIIKFVITLGLFIWLMTIIW